MKKTLARTHAHTHTNTHTHTHTHKIFTDANIVDIFSFFLCLTSLYTGEKFTLCHCLTHTQNKYVCPHIYIFVISIHTHSSILLTFITFNKLKTLFPRHWFIFCLTLFLRKNCTLRHSHLEEWKAQTNVYFMAIKDHH